MKLSKLTALALSIVLLLSCLTLPALAEDPVELVVAYVCSEPADQQLVIDAMNEILLARYNLKIRTIVPNFSNYVQQLTLLLSSNEQLDIFSELGARFSSDVANGSLYDMTDLLAQKGQGIVSAIGEKYLAAGQVAGRQYAVTTFRDLAKGFSFFMRADLCDKYNIDTTKITTLEQVGDALKIIYENEPEITPLCTTNTAYPSYRMTDVDQLGDMMGVLLHMGQDLNVVNYYDTDEYEKLIRTFRDWFVKGYINADNVTSNITHQEVMKAGQGFAYFDASKPNVVSEEEAKCGGYKIYECKIIPAFTYTAAPATLQWVITSKCKNPEAAMTFLNSLYTDADVMNLIAWGIEGKHYVKTEDGHITYPEGVNASNSGYNLMRGWAFGNQAITYIWEGNPLSAWDDLKQFNADAYVSKAFGFTWNATGYETEIAAVTAVFDEYRVALEFGLLDPDTYLPIFRQKLHDAGIDKIVASKQAQLNAWAAANNVQ